MSIVLSSTARIRDIPYASRVLVESSLGSCFSHFGLQMREWMTGLEEGEYTSLGSLLSILIFSILSTVNLFTGSDWSACFASHSTQNPS